MAGKLFGKVSSSTSSLDFQHLLQMTGVTVVELTDWSGLVRGRTNSFNSLTVIKPMTPAASFWSGPFRVTASDQRDYFVKSLETRAIARHRADRLAGGSADWRACVRDEPHPDPRRP